MNMKHSSDDNNENALTVNELLAKLGKKSKRADATDTKNISAQDKTTIEKLEKTTPSLQPAGEITREFYRITDILTKPTNSDSTTSINKKLTSPPLITKTITPSIQLETIPSKIAKTEPSVLAETSSQNIEIKSKKPKKMFFIELVELILTFIFGGVLFFSFMQLWKWQKYAAGIMSVLFTIVIMSLVINAQEKPKFNSIILAICVGIFVSFGPLIFLLKTTA